LKRILNFSFGSDFCSQFVNNKFNNIEHLTSSEIKDLYQFLEIENENDREKRKSQLDNLYAQQITTELVEQANKLGIINTSDDFNNYNRLLQLIPSQFNDEVKNRIKNIIYGVIALKSSEEFKPELWIKGIIEEAPFEYVSKSFLDKDTQTVRRISILSKLQTDKQFELLKLYSTDYDFEKAFTLIEELVKKENLLGYHFNLSEILFDTEFWNNKKCNDLINLFNDYVNNESSEEHKYKLFFKGYVKSIPQKLVYQNITNLEESDCRKIFQSLPENRTFIKEILDKKVISGNTSDVDWLYKLARKFLDKENFNSFDTKVFETIEAELVEQANKLGIINTSDDFNNYNRLLQLIPSQFNDEVKNRIKNIIYGVIALKSSEEFKPELWIKGIIEEAPFEYVSKSFLDKDTQTVRRISILSKLQTDKQFELLKLYSTDYDFEKAFTLIEELVKKENLLGYHFNLSEILFDTEFWNNKKCNDLIDLFNDYVNNESSEEYKYKLFFKGYVKSIPQKLVYQNITNLEESDCRKIFQSLPENRTFIKEILEKKAISESTSYVDWIYELARKFLDKENFNSFDTKVFETIEQSKYFKLWETAKAKILPKNHIGEILKDKFENYTQIKTWIDNNATTNEEVKDFLFSYLSIQVPVTDRIIFHKQLNHIKYLLQLNEFNLEKINSFRNDFYNAILWFLDKVEIFDFEQLKQKFIYFAPDEQVRIIRKLFFLKASGEFDLTIEKLNELTRFDLDLYKTNLNFNPEIPIDISTDVVIKALLSYKQNQRFLVENDLLAVILNDLKLDKTRRFRLSNYFENCLGRQTPKFDWSTEGEIRKINYGNNQFYFAISFSAGEIEWVNNRWGGREEYSPNPNFGSLKEAVEKLPKVKWNPNENHWGVPSRYETEVLTFAKEERFFLDFDGNNYSNNTHLADFKREEVPNGISFCEGRLANRPDKTHKKEFWWCVGQACFSKCETIHLKEEWEKYTLLDFCEILGFNTDETNKMGDHIPKGNYYQFIALINRFNKLLDKLYCSDCNHILYPSNFGTSHFAAHTVVRFQCRNETCSNNDEIYLNHCLNGQCNCIIDSRVSKRCDNGLFICDNCGSCCSHNMLERRLANLKLTGGYIHPDLIKCVNEKLGHLERGEYFCHKCKAHMKEVRSDVFLCPNCNIKYDATKYKFKRPHIYLRQTKATTSNNGNDDEN
jgi:hypothetical protein